MLWKIKDLIQLCKKPGCFNKIFACKYFLAALIYSSTTYTKYVSTQRFSLGEFSKCNAL